MKRLQIFKPGRHVATDGKTYSFTEADLKTTAAAYDPAKHEAPFVIGHPKTDDPAYGWAKSLAFAGGALDAEPDQVDAAFAEMVEAGRFKKISASFYAPDAAQNPVPGCYYLRHVGFLGATPPAVKGLKNAAFADADQGVIEFADWSKSDIAAIFRGLRDWIIEKFSLDEANKVIPDYLVASLTQDAAVAVADQSHMYAEQDCQRKENEMNEQEKATLKAREDKIAADAAALATEQAEFAERNKVLTAAEAKQKRADIVEFVDARVKEGKVLPALKDGLIAYMAGIDQAAVVEFGEGDKAMKQPALEWLKSYLAAQPKIVDFTERAGGEVDATLDAADPVAIAAKAVEFQEAEHKAGREISVTAAVQHVIGAAGGK